MGGLGEEEKEMRRQSHVEHRFFFGGTATTLQWEDLGQGEAAADQTFSWFHIIGFHPDI
jgi:hypothetical protein